MLEMSLLAFFNGMLLSLNRVFIARVVEGKGALPGSFWNHLGGLLILVIFVLATAGPSAITGSFVSEVPVYLYLGGAVGALFVALNSWIIPGLGMTKSVILTISGQMVFGALIDSMSGKFESAFLPVLGVGLILLGVLVSFRK